MDWTAFWDSKAGSENDLQATGRGLMDLPGYLHTVAEVVKLLDLKQGEHLIDVGCGAGIMALSLAPWLGSICAIDISTALVSRAGANLQGQENVASSVGSITRIPVPDSSAEKLLAYSVTQYLGKEENALLAMQEVARVLKPGGRALLAANPDPLRRGAYEHVVRQRPHGEGVNKELGLLDHLLWLSPKQMTEMAKSAGLHAKVEPLNQRVWQHFYMFHLLLTKP